MKGQKVESFWNKISSTGWKWSDLNAPGTGSLVSHSLLNESLFPIFCPCCFLSFLLWGNTELDLPVWKAKRWKVFGTKSAQQAGNGPIWMPQVLEALCLIHFWMNPFSPFSAPAASPFLLWGNKELDLPVWKAKRWKHLEQNQLNRLEIVQFGCPKVRNPCVSYTFDAYPLSDFANFHRRTRRAF